mgnify:CR=1 FL=1
MDKKELTDHINEIENMRDLIIHYLDGIQLHLDKLKKSLNMPEIEPQTWGSISMEYGKRLLTTKETAEYLGVKQSTLEQSRLSGNLGIPFVRLGRSIRYRLEDLELYVSKLKVYHCCPVNFF